MTVLFHGPPTRGPVMNFCESKREEEREREKKRKSRSLAAVSPRLTCILQSSLAPGVLCTERIMQRSASRAPRCPMGGELCRSVLAERNASRPIGGVFQNSCTHTGTWLGYAVHVSGTGEHKHCCCVKCNCSIDALALLTPDLKRANCAGIASFSYT